MNDKLLYYLVLINCVAFLAMALDKRLAQREGARRIPEKTLFALAVAGGAAGAIAGMYLFRHKTKHPQFVYGLPVILIVELAAYLLLGGRLSL